MSSTIGKLSKEEFRRQKDLDAARKAGTAPAEVDEEGNAINPHIPQFMAQAPWYLDTGKPSLKHQRKQDDTRDHVQFGQWYQRGARESKAATKYRKGACENCGAMSHKTKDCLERPRKKGARWSGKDIAADEIVSEVKGIDNDYEAKRDRWNGYNPTEHKHVIKEYEAIEEARRKLREEEVDRQTSADPSTAKRAGKKAKKGKTNGEADVSDFGSSDSDEEDEDKYAEKADMVGQKVDTDKRISVRNLRIREDRAKYLYNLNVDSAHYDPKSRSMREAPNPGVRPEDAQYAGDNFERSQGDAAKVQELQMFAWQSEARGNDVHMQANPTVNELQHREYQQKKEKLNQQIKGSILERYGGAEHFDSVPKELLTGQSDRYVEYTPAGQPIYNARRVVGGSREEKDERAGPSKQVVASSQKVAQLYDGNHASPFASWTDPTTGKSGYECCHSTVKNSYCTGDAGKQAQQASDMLSIKPKSAAAVTNGSDKEVSVDDGKRARKRRQRSASFSSSSSYSSRSDSDSYSSDDSRDSRHRRRKGKGRSTRAKGYSSRKDIGEGDVADRLDKGKLKEALAHEERRLRGGDGDNDGSAATASSKPEWLRAAQDVNARKKGKFNSSAVDDADVTEEQLEAYRMKNRNRTEDPMANYRDSGEV